MSDRIGRIYGDAVWWQFNFVAKVYYPDQFVEIIDDYAKDKQGSLSAIYRVTECRTKNKFYDTPEAIQYINEKEDVTRDTLFVYEAVLVSTIHENRVSDEVFPLYPGKPVYRADSLNISTAYNIKDTGLTVGYMLYSPDTKIRLTLNDVFNPHMFIVGKTGSGKSYFAKGLLRLMEKAKENYTVMVFSPSGEYNSSETDARNGLPVLPGSEIVIEYHGETMAYLWGLNASEEKVLANVSIDKTKIYSSSDLVREITSYHERGSTYQQISLLDGLDDNGGTNSKASLPSAALSLISKIKRTNIKFTSDKNRATEINKSYVIDMSSCSQSEQEFLLHIYLNRLLFNQKNISSEKRAKIVVFIEEAHNYIPSVATTMCKAAIIRLAREGRQFGVSLCMITQRPTHFDQTAFSQSGNKFIFALSHPDDVKKVLEDSPHYSDDLTTIIKRQRVGQCTVNGDAFQSTFTFKVDFGDD
ncbi:MAG: ATP-binding protein [Lachnospiraceae bacterium]|jgi:ABC-type dipeptide/oligopeptide/nickel transport system ATPase component|nr:ATP-binding protein [Lachnospiraceae bacterium]